MNISKYYSLKTKISVTFTLLGLFLLLILFVQIIPNMQAEQKESKKNQIEHTITITNEQIKLAVKLLVHSRESEILELKSKIDEIMNSKKSSLNDKCNIYSLEEAKKSLAINEYLSLKENKLVFYKGHQEHMCPKTTKSILYLKKLENNQRVVAKCNPQYFKNKHDNLEKDIKNDLQKTFELTKKDHKGKINLIWINTKHKDYSTKPLYKVSDKSYNMQYCVSKMSSVLIPQTGQLTAKQIVEASDKEAILHDNNTTYTWVKTLQNIPGRKLLFITSIYKKDFDRNFSSPLLKVLPAAILAFLIAIGVGLFLFKRFFKSINILTNTAKQINGGNINLRSNIEGSDDIAILAKTFDNMLDSIEKNINELDVQVEVKTKELRSSLDEKEILLKEIHHRVKNNLAMTINLIKFQKSKINDEKTKDTLTDIQERIFTMELLHRKLYESKDLNSISFKKYIIELLDDLENTYGKSRNIQIHTDIDELTMNIEYALPCGLIITEGIINAYKYAFDSNNGNINICFKKINNQCTLIIQDDGIGLLDEIDVNKTKTLGLRLISTIVKGQLFGDFSYEKNKGSIFTICFEYK